MARLVFTACCLFLLAGRADAQAPRDGAPAIPPLQLPDIDRATLSAEGRAAWHDVRTRFLFTSARVADAHSRLDMLSSRLHSRGLALNHDVAERAARMQAFLEESVHFIKRFDFDEAALALVRAGYQRDRLTDVIGR